VLLLILLDIWHSLPFLQQFGMVALLRFVRNDSSALGIALWYETEQGSLMALLRYAIISMLSAIAVEL
jgi:hypothetical protein